MSKRDIKIIDEAYDSRVRSPSGTEPKRMGSRGKRAQSLGYPPNPIETQRNAPRSRKKAMDFGGDPTVSMNIPTGNEYIDQAIAKLEEALRALKAAKASS